MPRRLLGFLIALILILVATSPCAAEEIWAEITGGAVGVYHIGAEYNCCWVIAAEVAMAGEAIDLYELRGPASEECDCICLFDLRFAFPAPPPGQYQLRVWRAVYDGQEPPLIAQLPLLIPTAGGGEVQVLQSPCGGWVTGVPDPPTPQGALSFSAIRALY
jgi:hypothetical protein